MNRFLLTVPLLFLLLAGLAGCNERQVVERRATATSLPHPFPPPTRRAIAAPVYTPLWEATACQFPYPPNVEIQCGTLIVPEDRANPARTIRLPVAIVASRSAAPEPDPVIFLDGGPGGNTLANAEYLITLLDNILEDRDLILFDQRGVGYSQPSLNCPELEEARLVNIEKALTDDQRLALKLAATTACYERLVAAGVNLSAYNSAASAADVEDLRQVLGYGTWNLLGVSYGSRLALTTMRDFGHTGAIRSVILDSVYPPPANYYADIGANANRAFDLLFGRCAALEKCNESYPHLRSRFYQLVDELNATPITVALPVQPDHTPYRVPFNGEQLMTTVFNMMYDKNQIIYLPKMLSQLERGSSPILANYLARNLPLATHFSEGLELSVHCVEEAPFIDTAAFRAEIATLSVPLAQLAETVMAESRATCEVWQVEAAAPLENEPVVSDISTLILAGKYDPVTPPAHARETADFLANSHLFEFEGIGHGVAGSSHCALELITTFLNQPDRPPDASCLDHLYFDFLR